MDTETDEDQKEFSTGHSHSLTTQPSTLSGITDSNTSPDGVLEEAVKDQKAEWEKATKACAKERDEAQRGISGALKKVHKATTKYSQDQESAVTKDIQQLFEKAKEMESNAIEMVEWRTEFDAEQKK
eukprot:5630032-Ditylum_brightwellii.AAC.1